MNSEDLFKESIGGNGYTHFYNYMKKCDITIFKQNENLNYMTEHLGERQATFGKLWLNEIYNLNMISKEEILKLIIVNDQYGNPEQYQIDEYFCSPNTLKYIYFGLLNIKTILQKNIENFNFIEIGGGYGGQCLILQSLFKKFNILVKKYVLIDLDEVVNFQKKYVNNHDPNNNCVFISCVEYDKYDFSCKNFLFSSYSLSELSHNVRNEYYKNLLPNIQNGFIVWNNGVFDFPIECITVQETPLTSGANKFVYF